MSSSVPPLEWNAAQPGSKVVQHAFVNARCNEINRTAKDLRARTVKAFREDGTLAPRIKGYSSAKKDALCEDAYDRLTSILQSRDLTINFNASAWFDTENPYETYAQLYERAMAGGRMILTDADQANLPNNRAAADDRVTFPANWANAPANVKRGLSPGGPGRQQIMGRMMAGNQLTPFGSHTPVLSPVPSPGYHKAWESRNPRFDPKSKQVFAALNYGRREAGSSTTYGNSYFVLHDHLKTDAIFFPRDTFYLPGADTQITYQTLGAIFLGADNSMRKDLVTSCFDGVVLPNTGSQYLLMEAHIFKPVRFADGVKKIVLEPKYATYARDHNDPLLDNVKKFCRKWGIHLVVPGEFEFNGT